MDIVLHRVGGSEPPSPTPTGPPEPLEDPDPSSSYPEWLMVVDPQGDHAGRIDVTRMLVNFDSGTGDYEIVLTADPSASFTGGFRVAINLFNPDVGSTSRNRAFFSDVRDYTMTQSGSELRLEGNNPVLAGWGEDHSVNTNSLEGTGNPDGISLFRSSVGDLPLRGFLQGEDVIAFSRLERPAIVRRRD